MSPSSIRPLTVSPTDYILSSFQMKNLINEFMGDPPDTRDDGRLSVTFYDQSHLDAFNRALLCFVKPNLI